MARPRFHLLTSTTLAYTLHRQWGWPAVAGAMGGGLLIDIDHLVDFAWTKRRGEKSHYLAPLHGWELASLLALVAVLATTQRDQMHGLPDTVVRPAPVTQQAWFAGLLVGLAAGVWLHLVHDVLTNRPRQLGVYSLLYRWRHGFRREVTGWNEEGGFHNWSDGPWYRWF